MEKYEVNQQKRLSDQQVMFQREMYGENRLPEEKEALYWQVF
jgi:Ca2+-transporting ATPase